MAGSKTVVAAVVLGAAAGFAAGHLGGGGDAPDAGQDVGALEARLAVLESATPTADRGRSSGGVEARLRALESRRVADDGMEEDLLALLDDPSPELQARLTAALKQSSATKPRDSKTAGKGDRLDYAKRAEKYADYVHGEIDRWAEEYALSGSQADDLKTLTRKSIAEITDAKLAGASARDISKLEVATQAEVRRIVGDDVYVRTERQRTMREARGLVPRLAASVGLTTEQHSQLDRVIEDAVERNLPDVVRIRSEPLPDAEHDVIRARLEGHRTTDWERIRDEILTEEQRRRIPGK